VFDCKYGTKNLGAELSAEWVRRVGTMAEKRALFNEPCLMSENTRSSGGSVGIPESRL
jgi:hypothetical protein